MYRILRRPFVLFIFFITISFGGPTGLAKTPLLAPAVISAKSIFVENETGDPAVLETAKKEFMEWGRFTFAASENDTELVIIFTHKAGMDKFSNVGFILMDVFVKDITDMPAFEAKNAVHAIWDPQRRTKVCISDFRKRLEKKK